MNKKLYGLYLAYHKDEVLPEEIARDNDVPDYPTEVARVRCYETKHEQLEAYANTMCSSSQIFEADSPEEFNEKVEKN